MTPERWLVIKDLFHSALAREDDDRAAYLDEACAGDEALKAEIESLIASHFNSENFLETETIELDNDFVIRTQNELCIGKSIGPYKISERLGAGGMASVYLAEDTRLGRHVALKLLSADWTKGEDRVRRFQIEARAASALNHPNIVTIHEIGEAEEGHFIVMELITGRTLRELIHQSDRIESIAALGAQMAKALSVAHAAGIIHRDIKPENIMVRDDGYVKVLDFGVARLSQPDQPTDKNATGKIGAATAPGIILGTLRYMSPEQARAERLTVATDIFSLGLVLYEMATGQHPFSAESQIAVAHSIISQPALSPSRINPMVPPHLETLILRMLEKDPCLRPDALEVEAALSAFDAKQPSAGMRPIAVSRKPRTVGREKERAEIREAFNFTGAGRGQLLCVSGEAGIGKTTLIEDFIAELSANGQECIVARGRCSERLAGTEAYLPFLEALENLLRSEMSDRIARAMKLIAPTWYKQVAPFAGDDSSELRLREDIKQASQERLKREISALLEELSRSKPLVIFLDDLHWADASTVELIAYLANHFEMMRVLIVTAHRSSDLLIASHPFLQVKRDLQARGVCHQIHLQFLTREDIERYLALEFPEHDFPDEFSALIYQKTEGSPLFMVDLVRYLKDEGVIAEEQGQWMLARAAEAIENKLPESVRGMIQRKVDQLSEKDLHLMVGASVQGYEFDSAVIARALWIDPAEVEDRLHALDRIYAFIRLVKERELPDRTITLRYRFVHALYQNALYASIMPTRRAALSASVAEALADFYGDQRSNIASRLALLFEAARDATRASEYFLMAAENASRVLAYQEVVALARRGLELVRLLADTEQRTERELLLRITLGVPLMATSGYAAREVEENYLRAKELCEQLGDNHHLLSALSGLWNCYLVRADYKTAGEMAAALLTIAEAGQEKSLLAEIYWINGTTSVHLGELKAALDFLEKGIAFSGEQTESLNTGHHPGVACRSMLGWTLWYLGYPDRALKNALEAVEMAETLSHPQSLALAHFFVALQYYFRRDAQKVEKISEQVIVLSSAHGLRQTLAWATVTHGWAIAECGRGDEGIAEIRESLAMQRAMGAEIARPAYLGALARAYHKAGLRVEAMATIDEAIGNAQESGEIYHQADMLRFKGEMMLMEPAEAAAIQAEAEKCFREALKLAREQGAKSLELRAAMSLARLLSNQNRKPEARQILAETYEWFTEGFETADLTEARKLIEEYANAQAS